MYDWNDMNDFNKVEKACAVVMDTIKNNSDMQIIIDVDCDGYCSAAILGNYLFKRFPEWTENHLSFIHHTGKQHGLKDIMNEIDCDCLICPDGGTNDFMEQMELELNRDTRVIILDHHDIEDVKLIEGSTAIIINVQNSHYPNKALTGAGVCYKFISAFEDLYIHGNQPNELLDLCALGNCGDMADYRELEIRGIIKEGFSNITNPFLHELCKKHKYTLDKRNGVNYLSMAFAAVPFINAITRSGTMEDKDMVFKAMLVQHAFDKVPSSKRGEKGVEVYRYQEAVTVAERVKRNQDKLTQETVEILERKIAAENLDQNAIIVFCCEPDEVEANIAGLAANKIQAKYQHPTLVLRRSRQKDDKEDFYRGSARNYSHCPVQNMKDMCAATGIPEYCAGHQSAFGFSIAASRVEKFIKAANELYKDVDFTPRYWVDYIWTPRDLQSVSDIILTIGKLDIYGQEIPESLVAIKNIPLSESNVTILGLAKGRPTLKITSGNIEIIKFGSSEEEYEEFIQPNMTLTAVCKCGVNEWEGIITPQLLVEDYELKEKWVF